LSHFLLPELAKSTTLKSDFKLENPRPDGDTITYDSKLITSVGEGHYTADTQHFGMYHYETKPSSEPITLSSDILSTLISGSSYDIHTWTITHSAQVEILKGTNIINVSGTTEIRVHCVHFEFGGGIATAVIFGMPKDLEWWRTGSLQWKFTITLSSVTSGELSVEITPSSEDFKKSIEPLKFEEGGNLFYQYEEAMLKLFGSKFDDFHERCTDHLNTLFGKTVDVIEMTKKNLNSNVFVFPGGKEFKMKDPCFNNELDLLVKTEYEFY
jgi:hypothetical protein